jgi:hypothetical protein
MRQMRIERKSKIPREARNPILPLDPRDPDVLRAKEPGGTPIRSRY